MNSLFSKHMCLYFYVLLSATHAAAGSADRSYTFSPCPDPPNCISSQSADKAHSIEPLHYGGSLADARQKIIDILNNTNRVHLEKVKEDYIHAEFRSRIFQFTDDVELYFPPDQAIIHVKSASRKGYYDFGANRRRVERLRAAFKKLAN